MRGAIVSALVVAFVSLMGCAIDTSGPDPESLDEVSEGVTTGKWCTTTGDCNASSYCSTEAGDCFPPPNCKGDLCPLVCWGRCTKIETCGDVTCVPGEVCCNESCGICTPPGGVCIQTVCEPSSSF